MKSREISKMISTICLLFAALLFIFNINPILLATSKEITSQNDQATNIFKMKIRLKYLNEKFMPLEHNLLKRTFDLNNSLSNIDNFSLNNKTSKNSNSKVHGIDYIGYSSFNENNFSIDLSLNNSSNDSYESGINSSIERGSRRYWALILIFIPLCTIVGNVLVVVSVVKEKNLHTVTNYFVVSLAIADLAVASTVMPFAVYYEVSFN
jgi:hypothetical protein